MSDLMGCLDKGLGNKAVVMGSIWPYRITAVCENAATYLRMSLQEGDTANLTIQQSQVFAPNISASHGGTYLYPSTYEAETGVCV